MQALVKLEYSTGILRGDADAVIFDPDPTALIRGHRGNADSRQPIPTKLDAICHQILE
jgi:hypothetical protein